MNLYRYQKSDMNISSVDLPWSVPGRFSHNIFQNKSSQQGNHNLDFKYIWNCLHAQTVSLSKMHIAQDTLDSFPLIGKGCLHTWFIWYTEEIWEAMHSNYKTQCDNQLTRVMRLVLQCKKMITRYFYIVWCHFTTLMVHVNSVALSKVL